MIVKCKSPQDGDSTCDAIVKNARKGDANVSGTLRTVEGVLLVHVDQAVGLTKYSALVRADQPRPFVRLAF